jgi:hypothetical protein
MTHVAGGSRRGIPKAWVLPLLAMVLILAGIALDLLSRSIVVDFAAWWPVWALLLVLTIVLRGRRLGKVRLSGLVPILWVVALGVFVTGHVQGWQAMPSASVQLIGPSPEAGSNVALSADIDGTLEVGTGESGFLYEVEPVRSGGDVGTPEATEQVQGTNISVHLRPVTDPGLYTFSGWAVDLHESPVWNLSLGGSIEADLSRLRLTGLQLNGVGQVALGGTTESVVVNVNGAFRISVPAGTPVRVAGDAVVPDGWVKTSGGSASATPGNGWVISVAEGTSLTVIEQ